MQRSPSWEANWLALLYAQYLLPTCCSVFIVINYRSDTFWSQLSVIFKEFTSLSMCAADVGQILHMYAKIIIIKILKISLWLNTIKRYFK